MSDGDTATLEAQPARAPSGGYRKGEETRQRILAVALVAFGGSGFDAVTTRRIAQDAGVKLPALTYYFGGKEGLYRACAEDIVARWREGVELKLNGSLEFKRFDYSDFSDIRNGKPYTFDAGLMQVYVSATF